MRASLCERGLKFQWGGWDDAREVFSVHKGVDNVCAAQPAWSVRIDRAIHRVVPRVCTHGDGVVHRLSP